MKKVIVLVTDGSEEMEVVIIVDILRRSKIEVSLVSIGIETNQHVVCSRNIKLIPDYYNEPEGGFDGYDGIIIPGGAKGSETLSKDTKVLQLLNSFFAKGRLVASVCAGTLVLKEAKIAAGFKVTSHPSVKDKLVEDFNYKDERVVLDRNVITSRAPGTSFEFALAIVNYLVGKSIVEEVEPGLLLAQNALS